MNLKYITTHHGKCSKCVERVGGPVLFEGAPSPILFMAEALGAMEAFRKRPLIGPAGQVFNRILTAANIKREEVFLCNSAACRPPDNKINASMVKNCRPIREALIEACSPKVIVALGATAMRALCPKEKSGILAMRGRVLSYKNIPVVVTVHPSYVMRQEKEVREDAFSKKTLAVLKTKVLNDFLLAKKLAGNVTLNITPREPQKLGGSYDRQENMESGKSTS